MRRLLLTVYMLFGLIIGLTLLTARAASPTTPDNATHPSEPVKLVFIHHSCGGNWLADIEEHDQAGGLGQALMDHNYFVSATNYGWGPGGIGTNTDIPNWPEWFTDTVMSQVYTEYAQNICGMGEYSDWCFGNWTRMADPNPVAENEIIMFKSCYPNSDLYGNPTDPPLAEPNDQFTVENAKAVYNHILNYFEAHQDKLFIVITAPPMAEGEYALNDSGTPSAERAANARAFNTWLVNDWLAGYPHNNIAVFDYYNVLTSNGSDTRIDDTAIITESHDYDLRPDGNHHYWDGSQVTHTQTIDNNYSAYPSYSGGPDWYDSHPMTNGQQKATVEFVQLLNVFYNRWKNGGTSCTPLTGVTITGSESGYTGTLHTFTAGITPANASTPITYTWTLAPNSGQGNLSATYTWATTGTKTITFTAENCGGSDTATHTITIQARTINTYYIYLPLLLRDYGTVTPPSGELVQPGDLSYRGAFRLPGGDTPPLTFAYGGNGMTFNPDGNPQTSDGYPGSLFITGHDRQAWGTLPNGSQVAEVNIPTPAIAANPADLPQAAFIQDFHDVTAGYFTKLEEIPKIGIQYLNHADTGPLIHIGWGQHLQLPAEPSHAWFSANLTTPNIQGAWFIGHQNLYSTNGYMFDIPATWANANAEGRPLATGRMRDGGQGGMGPALFAYRPWESGGTAPISGTHIPETVLLLYENSDTTEQIIRCLDNYQHPDEWQGGAWITTPSGKSAVLFAGTKSNGAKYWYGFIHPDGPQYPCVDSHVTDFPTCRMADGSLCPEGDMEGCCEDGIDCVSNRGWWTTRFDAQFILYDPDDLAGVAAGTMQPYEPQPYIAIDIDDHLYLAPPEWDEVELGWDDQRRARIGATAYDRENGYLYVLELYADGAKPVVHVWHVD